jgi:hypothetical protein
MLFLYQATSHQLSQLRLETIQSNPIQQSVLSYHDIFKAQPGNINKEKINQEKTEQWTGLS